MQNAAPGHNNWIPAVNWKIDKEESLSDLGFLLYSRYVCIIKNTVTVVLKESRMDDIIMLNLL